MRLLEYLSEVDDVRPIVSQFNQQVDFELVEKLIKSRKSAKKPPAHKKPIMANNYMSHQSEFKDYSRGASKD